MDAGEVDPGDRRLVAARQAGRQVDAVDPVVVIRVVVDQRQQAGIAVPGADVDQRTGRQADLFGAVCGHVSSQG